MEIGDAPLRIVFELNPDARAGLQARGRAFYIAQIEPAHEVDHRGAHAIQPDVCNGIGRLGKIFKFGSHYRCGFDHALETGFYPSTARFEGSLAVCARRQE